MLENVGKGGFNMLKIAVDFVKSLGLDVNVIEWNGESLGNYDKANDTISLNIRKIIKIHKKAGKRLIYAKSLIKPEIFIEL
jgi:hypothetical protein